MKFKQFYLNEFEQDLKKQVVVLMGLPAAGKTRFINNEIKNIIPNFKTFKVTNSDAQIKALQFALSQTHFNWLKKNVKDEKTFEKFKQDTTYKNNDGQPATLDIKWEEFQNFKKHSEYWNRTFKSFYANYFDIRDLAKIKEKALFKDKIKKAGNLLIIDTVASVPSIIFKRIKSTKDEGFVSTIIYLEIDVNLAIERDKWRKQNSGRGVGENIIQGYAKNMAKAFQVYKAEGKKPDGFVDRLLHFTWKPSGNSPVKGQWTQKSDEKFFIRREIEKRRKEK